jgi:selenocysteine lyase/cysteine desulfurase
MNKREFVRIAGGAGLGLLFGDRLWAEYSAMPVERLAEDEAFWAALRGKYRLKPEYINLENGYYSMQSQPVLEAFIARVREVNLLASRYMRTTQIADKLAVRAKLAALAGCSTEELIITRNTTESLDTVIAGFDWKPGDDAVYAAQDYGAMRDMFALQARRYGMKTTVVSLPVDPTSDEEIVSLYASAITPRTRLLMICHMVNITGHILPVRKICDMAHARGVDVMVDGAHAFAHLDFRIPDLGCDYYGASLHKWLLAPVGTGILYVRRDRIERHWPLQPSAPSGSIRKFEEIGTHPAANHNAIADALAFHHEIGGERKAARLRYLKNRWAQRLSERRGFQLLTGLASSDSCALGSVKVEGLSAGEVTARLWATRRILTAAIVHPEFEGVRVSPNVYTTLDEIDRFSDEMERLARMAT